MDTQKAEVIAKERQVKLEVDRLSDMVDQVTGLVDNLCSRLSRVLRGEPPREPEDVKAEEMVELASDIRKIRYAVENQKVSLVGALDRLEI